MCEVDMHWKEYGATQNQKMSLGRLNLLYAVFYNCRKEPWNMQGLAAELDSMWQNRLKLLSVQLTFLYVEFCYYSWHLNTGIANIPIRLRRRKVYGWR